METKEEEKFTVKIGKLYTKLDFFLKKKNQENKDALVTEITKVFYEDSLKIPQQYIQSSDYNDEHSLLKYLLTKEKNAQNQYVKDITQKYFKRLFSIIPQYQKLSDFNNTLEQNKFNGEYILSSDITIKIYMIYLKFLKMLCIYTEQFILHFSKTLNNDKTPENIINCISDIISLKKKLLSEFDNQKDLDDIWTIIMNAKLAEDIIKLNKKNDELTLQFETLNKELELEKTKVQTISTQTQTKINANTLNLQNQIVKLQEDLESAKKLLKEAEIFKKLLEEERDKLLEDLNKCNENVKEIKEQLQSVKIERNAIKNNFQICTTQLLELQTKSIAEKKNIINLNKKEQEVSKDKQFNKMIHPLCQLKVISEAIDEQDKQILNNIFEFIKNKYTEFDDTYNKDYSKKRDVVPIPERPPFKKRLDILLGENGIGTYIDGLKKTENVDIYITENNNLYNNIISEINNLYEDIAGTVRTIVRIKGGEISKFNNDQNDAIKVNGTSFTVTCMDKSSTYSGFYVIFPKECSNFDMYYGFNPQEKTVLNKETYFQVNYAQSRKKYESNLPPCLKASFDQVKQGYSIVLFSYGYSGSGKTYTLFGNENDDGILLYGLRDLLENGGATEISIHAIFEEYINEFDFTTGNVPKLSGKIIRLFPDSFDNVFKDWNPKLDAREFSDTMFNLDGNIKVRDIDINTRKINKINKILDDISRIRTNSLRIKKTPNNDTSSRSHLYIIFKIQFQNFYSYITIIDMAGRENPADILNMYFDFEEKENKNCNMSTALWMKTKFTGYNQNFNTYCKKIKDDYNDTSIDHIKKIFEEGFYINESINHLKYFLKIKMGQKLILENYWNDIIAKYNSIMNESSKDPNKLKQSQKLRQMLIKYANVKELKNFKNQYNQTEIIVYLDNTLLPKSTQFIKKVIEMKTYNPQQYLYDPSTGSQWLPSPLSEPDPNSIPLCLTGKILKYLNNLKGNLGDENKPTKFIMICNIRRDQEARFCGSIKETMEFAKEISR